MSATRRAGQGGEPHTDLYARITRTVIAQLEQGVRPWVKPWSTQNTKGRITRPLRHNGVAYRGINVVLLWIEAVARDYGAPMWLTFRQALALGGHVRKGEKGTVVVFADRIVRHETDDSGEAQEKVIPFLKSYVVFNVEQIDALPPQYYGRPEHILDPAQRIAAAETFAAHTRAVIEHGGTCACYSLAEDIIRMPPFETFTTAEDHYNTLNHELAHWTRHESRLNRDLGRKQWGDAGYAMEELVAEMASAFLAADLGLAMEPREDHASYIAGWLTVLRNDKRAIVTAAAHAQRAADYLHSLQPGAAAADTESRAA